MARTLTRQRFVARTHAKWHPFDATIDATFDGHDLPRQTLNTLSSSSNEITEIAEKTKICSEMLNQEAELARRSTRDQSNEPCRMNSVE